MHAAAALGSPGGPGTRGRVGSALALVLALGTAAAGCSSGGSGGGEQDEGPGQADLIPDVAALDLPPPCGPVPELPAFRTARMGWGVNPPRPGQGVLFDLVDSMVEVSELGLVLAEVPWGEVLGGTPVQEAIESTAALTDFLGARGLGIVLGVDPLDGFDRRREVPALEALGRSIREPEIRQLHEEYVLALIERVRPAYFSPVQEPNTLGAHGDPELYAEIVDLVNTLAPRIRRVSPETRIFTSVQVEDFWFGELRDPVPHAPFLDDFDVDVMGLSSYPYFVFDDPADMPCDYLTHVTDQVDLPVLIAEAAWASGRSITVFGTPEEQAEYYRLWANLANQVEAEIWVSPFYSDIDFKSLDLDLADENEFSNFSNLGIVDDELVPKPSHRVWKDILALPLR